MPSWAYNGMYMVIKGWGFVLLYLVGLPLALLGLQAAIRDIGYCAAHPSSVSSLCENADGPNDSDIW